MQTDHNGHAIKFFLSYKNKIDAEAHNFEYDALIYVKKQADFEIKDKVAGDTLVMLLENMGYLEIQERDEYRRFHVITEKGVNFLYQHGN